MDSQGFIALCYSLAVVFIVGVASYAFFMGYRFRKRILSTESFITARNQVQHAWVYAS